MCWLLICVFDNNLVMTTGIITAYPKRTFMVVTKGICPAISYCLDQVWHIGYEVDVSLLSCVRIGDLVDNVGI